MKNNPAEGITARKKISLVMKSMIILLLLFPVSFSGHAQDRSEWFEFYLPWDDSSKNITDLSGTLDTPAGKYGFLQVTPDGHFKFEHAAENYRFAGVVNVAISNFPAKELAPVLAARMAKFGINLVRIHLVDVEGQYGLFENSAENTIELSVDRFDKMDYFIKCLKDKGIYINFCIHSGRIYKEADGIPAVVTNNQAKYVTLFNQEIIGLQQLFASHTIGHLNPYTGLTYADDPVLANIELTNENQLFNGWFGWQRDFLFADHPDGIGPYYAAELDTLFNLWLIEKYQSDEALRNAWSGMQPGESLESMNISRVPHAEIGKYSDHRVADNAEFYFNVEGRYIDTMMRFLKEQVGVKVPVTFTNNYFGLASIYSQSRADYMDMHAYWDHPNYPNGWSDTDFTLHNQPMVKDPAGSTLNHMQLSRVEGMPLVLSEYNHPYPQIYQCEAPSLLYAYGSLMDLDGILWHAYYDYMGRYSQRYQDMFFDIAMHPVMMTHQLLSVPYRMGYIEPAPVNVRAQYTEQSVFGQTKNFQDDRVLNMEEEKIGASFLTDGFVHAGFNADTTALLGNLSMPAGVISSGGGELTWDGNAGIVTVNNPYWQGATGFLSGKDLVLDDIILSDIQTTNGLGFASVHLIAMDSLPISQSRNLVLITGARMENEGFQWNENKRSPVAIGGKRALCEPVKGLLSMNFASRDSFFMFRLDETGARSDTVFMADTAGVWTIPFGDETLWYEILNDSAIAVTGPEQQ